MRTNTRIRWSIITLLAAVMLSGSMASHCMAQLGGLLRRVDADPNQSYDLTEANGPYLIMACTFSGEQGADQARQLIIELRKKHKMSAYFYRMTFEQKPDEDLGMGFDRYGNKAQFVYQKPSNQRHNEYAVFVGDFPEINDSKLQSTLEDIKKMKPDALKLGPGGATFQNLAGWRQGIERHRNMGPMSMAFATTNPMLPKDHLNMKGVVDEFVANLNADLKYSLLKNRAAYTLKVATFSGKTVIRDAEIQKIESGREEWQSHLELAADRAHRLCLALRAKEYDAWEFHDRTSSIVTIGSWNQIGQKMPNGTIELSPEIVDLMNRFKAEPATGTLAGGMRHKTIIGIPFDASPMLVHVPRQSVAAQYAPQNASRPGLLRPY